MPSTSTWRLSLNNLALVDMSRGRYAAAEAPLKRALAITEKAVGPDHPNVATALNNLAETYLAQGLFAEAEPLHKRALAILETALGRDNVTVALSLTNIANASRQQNRYPEAEALLQRALAIQEKALGPEHRDVAAALGSLAALYREQARYAEAEPLHKRALATFEKALGPDHVDVANSLSGFALLYQRQDRFADAEPLYKRSLAIYEKALGPDHPDLALPLNRLAELYDAQGRHAEALPFVERSIKTRRAVPAVALSVLFGAHAKGLVPSAKALDDGLEVVQRASQTAAAAAVVKLAVRLAAGSDSLARLVRRDQDLAAEAETLDKRLVEAVSKEPSKRTPAAEQAIRQRLASIALRRESLRKALATDYPDYAALSDPPTVTAKEIEALLKDDEALVLLFPGKKVSHVFVAVRGAFELNEIPVDAAALSDKIARLRRGLDVDMVLDAAALSARGKSREMFDVGLAHELYSTLLGPSERRIKDKKHLIVVPVGPLTALPFHLLVTDKPPLAVPSVDDTVGRGLAAYRDAAWLVKRHAVTVLPSVASLKALRVRSRRPQGDEAADRLRRPGVRLRSSRCRRPARPRRSRRREDPRLFRLLAWRRRRPRQARRCAAAACRTRAEELKAVRSQLGAPASDIHLGATQARPT